MKVNLTKEKTLKTASFAFRQAGNGIRFTGKQLNNLNDQEENEDNENQGFGDPSAYLSSKELSLFQKMSDQKRQKLIERSVQKVNHQNQMYDHTTEMVREQAGEMSEKVSHHAKTENPSQRYTEALRVQQKFHAGNTMKLAANLKKNTENNKKGFSLATQNHIISGVPRMIQGAFLTKQDGQRAATGAAARFMSASQIAASGTQTAGTAAAGAVTGGAAAAGSIATKAGKKTADAVRKALIAKTMTAEANLGQALQKAEAVRNENMNATGIKQVASFVGASIATVILGMLQMLVSIVGGIIGVFAGILAVVLISITIIVTVVTILLSIFSNQAGVGGEQIVAVALSQEGTTDGSKYWNYTMGSAFVDGSSTPWCACFVSWCANECGYIDDGIFPKSGSVATYRTFYRERGLLHEEDGYTPNTGDLILFGSDDHIGIVQYVEGGRVITIEGNTSDAVHSRSYDLNSSEITGYCTPEYPGGTAIIIPDGMGVYHTYMGWHTITSPTSRQYQLRQKSGENYDSEGFAKIDGRYVIACTTTFGKVGDYIDFYRENGEVIHAIIGDIKNQNDPGCNQYGHQEGRCVVEYVVSRSWYPSHANPGTEGCHPEWNYRVVKAVNLGKNYLD